MDSSGGSVGIWLRFHWSGGPVGTVGRAIGGFSDESFLSFSLRLSEPPSPTLCMHCSMTALRISPRTTPGDRVRVKPGGSVRVKPGGSVGRVRTTLSDLLLMLLPVREKAS